LEKHPSYYSVDSEIKGYGRLWLIDELDFEWLMIDAIHVKLDPHADKS
jgi:hypothetical protein